MKWIRGEDELSSKKLHLWILRHCINNRQCLKLWQHGILSTTNLNCDKMKVGLWTRSIGSDSVELHLTCICCIWIGPQLEGVRQPSWISQVKEILKTVLIWEKQYLNLMFYVGGLLWRFGNLIKWVVSNRNVSNAGFEENSNLRTSKGVLAQLEPFRRFHTKVVCVCLFEDTPCLLQMLRILVFATFLPRTEATFATFVSRQYLSVSHVSQKTVLDHYHHHHHHHK